MNKAKEQSEKYEDYDFVIRGVNVGLEIIKNHKTLKVEGPNMLYR